MTPKELKKFILFRLEKVNVMAISPHIKSKYPEEYNQILEFTKFLNFKKDVKFVERLYCILNDIKELQICRNKDCDNYVTFGKFRYGYNKHCSNSCAQRNEEIKEKKKQTYLKNFGVDHNFKSPEIREKIKQTCLERYEEEYATQSEEIQEKSKKTCLEKYGTEYPMQSEEIKEKTKKTCLKKYGVENPWQSNEIKEKIRQVCQEKYGTEHASQNEEVKEKIKNTMMERYGVENPLQSPEIREKIEQTCLEIYGTEHPMQNEEIKEKSKEAFFKNNSRYISWPNIGSNEKQLLDEYEKENSCILERNFTVGPYYPDGYDRKNNVVVEIYEKFHLDQSEKDLEREKWIQEKLDCEFIIIWDPTH